MPLMSWNEDLLGLINAFLFGVWYIYCWWKKICTTYFTSVFWGHHCGARFLPSTIIGKHQLCQCVFAGYSSGSAGGTVFPETAGASDSPEAPNATEVTAEVPAPTEEANEPKHKPPDPSLAEHEAALKERLEQHMKMLEDKFYNELLDRKRAAEQDLEIEIESKRQKKTSRDWWWISRWQNSETSMSRSNGSSIDGKNATCSRWANCARWVAREITHSETAVGRSCKTRSPLTSTSFYPIPSLWGGIVCNEGKTSAKTAGGNFQETCRHTRSPQPPQKPEVSGLPDKPKGDIVVPISNTRFTSSTHPEAWHFLYRINKKVDDKDSLPEWQKEVYEQWHAGLSAPNF